MERMLCALLVGAVIVGPIVCWLAGLFNPIGYLGVLPWRVPPEARNRHHRPNER